MSDARRGASQREAWRIFLDTSALFAATWSDQGGGRQLLRLGEAGLVQLLVSDRVLIELERTFRSKGPGLLGQVALLLDTAGIVVVATPSADHEARCQAVIAHPPDAEIVAAAWTAVADYFVTLDEAHLLGNESLEALLPFPVGRAGDCLAWLRRRLVNGRPLP